MAREVGKERVGGGGGGLARRLINWRGDLVRGIGKYAAFGRGWSKMGSMEVQYGDEK